MNEKIYTEILPQNDKAIELKPWQTPMIEELALGQTENSFTSATDGTFAAS